MWTDRVPERGVLLFDGDCAFCSSSVRVGARLIRRMPAVAPYQTTDLAAFGLTEAVCADAVHYVRADGTVFVAHDAVSAVLCDAGSVWWLLGSLMRLPGVHWSSGAVYRWVARHRSRLPGGTPACAVNDPRRPT